MPKESGAAFASGNQATCTTVGFLYQFGLIGTYLSNSSLALVGYLMVHRHKGPKWTERHLTKLERKIRAAIFVIAFGIAIACIPLTLYNPSFSTCHIEAIPNGCQQSWTLSKDGADDDVINIDDPLLCERGDNAFLYSLAFNILPLWVCIVLSVLMMFQIYRYVRGIELTSRKYRQQNEVKGFSGSEEIIKIQELTIGVEMFNHELRESHRGTHVRDIEHD